ncbi:cytochrome P450 [Streptomyces sp. ST2-7A]|uniref:cytochrome P450 n=1 Tax=Streptomyces sp. ST2-7A TaxID=2907214 RepID=UPI001F386950|nr:cytochrome P450 [Streptomyces sp. ST2-7A]MCE7079493.1 cytochrome P450 [Streptomyces sp. ST2-7A]
MTQPTMSVREALTALATPEGRRDPYPLYEVLRGHGDPARSGPGRLVVTGYRTCSLALRDNTLLVPDSTAYDETRPGWRRHSSLRGFTDSMLFSNPPDHGRLRALVGFAFTPPRVGELRSVIEGMADRLLDRLAGPAARGEPVDLVEEFAARLPMAVISTMLGFPERDERWFRETAAAVAVSTDGMPDETAMARADSAMDALTAYFGKVTGERREQPGGDLVTHLTRVRDATPQRLSEAELMGNLMVLLTAGFETTSFLIAHGVLLALAHPDHARRLRTDPDFAPGFVEEALRMEPPVHLTSRLASADTELDGTALPRGTRLTLVLAAANRDPERFIDPHRFVPDRPGNQSLSFGAGGHFCLGAPLARLEAAIALPRLLRRFPSMRTAGAPVHRDRRVVRGLARMPLYLAD